MVLSWRLAARTRWAPSGAEVFLDGAFVAAVAWRSVWPAFAARKELLVNEVRLAVPRPSGRPTGARVARVEGGPFSSLASHYVVRCETANEEPGASR